MTIGNRIKLRRIELGWSQIELAKRMGYRNRSSISNVEKDRSDMQIELVKKFADVLGVKATYLLGLNDNVEPDYGAIDTDLIAELVNEPSMLNMIKLYKLLSNEHQEAILEQIEFYREKEQG